MADDLDKELARLEARSDELAEGGTVPRGALPALFRALTAATPDQQADGARRLAPRLADLPLVAPTLDWVRANDQVATWIAELQAATTRRTWCALHQAAALATIAPEPTWLLDALALLLGDGADPDADVSALALAAGVEPTCAALEEVLRLRLVSPASKRDRTSARLAEGALRALTQATPDVGPIQSALTRILQAETRRAGKGEPTLALAALDGMTRVPALDRVRLLHGLLPRITRKKVADRGREVYDAALAEAGLSPAEAGDLTARDGGADPDGWVRLPLEEGGEARVRIGAAGEPEWAGDAGTCREDERTLAAAARALTEAHAELARRLELALVAGRTWPVALWAALFRAEHPLWRDLAGRLAWEIDGAGFAVADEGLVDLFGEPFALPSAGEVALLHPVALDADELELWREWALERARPAPFPQLYRAVEAVEPETLEERFVGRELYKRDLDRVAQARGWSGTPLAGGGPWRVSRATRGLTIRVHLERVEVKFKATLQQRKTAHRRAKEGEKVVIRGHDDAMPRVKITSVEQRGAPDPIALAEAAYDLHALTDGLACPDDLFLRQWQDRKWKDAPAAWKEVVLAYRRGNPARLDARRALITAYAGREGLTVRLEDRFAIAGNVVLELGTGLAHEGPPKDHLPGWKLEERLAPTQREPAPLPFIRAAEPETIEVVERVLALARAGRA